MDHPAPTPTAAHNPHLPTARPSDSHLVEQWLAARASRSPHTRRNYAHAAADLLAWLTTRHLALLDLDPKTAVQYLDEPRHPPLSDVSREHRRLVLASLFRHLQDLGACRHNPFAVLQPYLRRSKTLDTKAIPPELWLRLAARLRDETDTDPDDIRKRRDRWLVNLLYHTGIRREEAVSATFGDIFDAGGVLCLRIRGKGRILRDVVLNTTLARELALWRTALQRHLAAHGERIADTTPLIPSLHTKRSRSPLTPRALNLIFGTVMRHLARDWPNPAEAQAIARISPHTLRHTNATHRLLAGASLDTTQQELGHASPVTTRHYARTTLELRAADAEKLADMANRSTTTPKT